MEERKGYRNGSYPRQLTTRVGRLTLRVPRTRNGELSTELFQRYQRSEQALVLALMEMVVNRVSTRKNHPNHKGVVRHLIFQIHGFLAMQRAGSDYPRLEPSFPA